MEKWMKGKDGGHEHNNQRSGATPHGASVGRVFSPRLCSLLTARVAVTPGPRVSSVCVQMWPREKKVVVTTYRIPQYLRAS